MFLGKRRVGKAQPMQALETPVACDRSSQAPSTRLRNGCAAAHAATERSPLLVELARGDLAGAKYARVMSVFADLFGVVAESIAKSPEGRALLALTDLEARGARAKNDADALGSVHRGPTPSVEFVCDHASALGTLYTLEGSRMGSAVIGMRMLAAGRPLGAPGYSFFDVRKDAAAHEWRAFKRLLDERLTSETELCRAVRAARAAFGLTRAMFSEV
jgi:heme oxygenase